MKHKQFAKNQMMWFDEALITDPNEEIFTAEYWQNRGKVIGSACGRGTTWFIQTDTLQAALRHYRRGGLIGKLIKDSYWFTGWEKTRSHQEFLLLQHLIQAGVNVPRPIAAQATRKGLIYQADLISEKAANAEDLVVKLTIASLSPEDYRAIGDEIAKMHAAQVNHTDLNIHNILLGNDNKVWIIDFDKCHISEGEEWKKGNLDRLKRSFHKEVKKRNIHWQEDDFSELLAGYKGYRRETDEN